MAGKNAKMIPCVKTDWYDSFRCVGGDCPYTCCGGYWIIDVDEKTDRRYRALEGEFGAKLNEWVDRTQKPSCMRLNAQGRCGMLTDEGWCSIQRKLGEEYLSDTCRTFPRSNKERKGVLFSYLSSSCPEVACQQLTRTEPFRLEQGREIPCGSSQTDATALAAFNTGFRILQDRACGIVQRQKLFLMLHQALRDASGDAKATEELLNFFGAPSNYRALAAEPDKNCDLVAKLRLLTRLCQPLLRDLPVMQTTLLFEEILGTVISDADAIVRAEPYLVHWNSACASAQENILVDGCLYHYADERCGDGFAQASYIVVFNQLMRIFFAIGSQRAGEILPIDEQVKYLTFLSYGLEHSGALKKQVGERLRDEGIVDLSYLFHLIS